MSRRVLVEYTKEVQAYPRHEEDGDAVTFPEGTRREVDARSAKALVSAGTAKLVGNAEEKAEARKTLKSTETGGTA